MWVHTIPIYGMHFSKFEFRLGVSHIDILFESLLTHDRKPGLFREDNCVIQKNLKDKEHRHDP